MLVVFRSGLVLEGVPISVAFFTHRASHSPCWCNSKCLDMQRGNQSTIPIITGSLSPQGTITSNAASPLRRSIERLRADIPSLRPHHRTPLHLRIEVCHSQIHSPPIFRQIHPFPSCRRTAPAAFALSNISEAQAAVKATRAPSAVHACHVIYPPPERHIASNRRAEPRKPSTFPFWPAAKSDGRMPHDVL